MEIAIVASHDESLRTLIILLLKRLGYQVEVYNSIDDVPEGWEGLILFHYSSRSYSLTTMDEAVSRFPQAKFIFIRLNPDGTEPGVVLSVPFKPQDLQDALDKVNS